MADADTERFFEAMENRFFGKYRGTVVDNNDSLGGNRLEVRIPGVSGQETKWALPCVPYAAADLGLHAIPPVGASVWIEFEGGELDHPIWVGCFWDENERVPGDSPEVVVLKTPGATRPSRFSPWPCVQAPVRRRRQNFPIMRAGWWWVSWVRRL